MQTNQWMVYIYFFLRVVVQTSKILTFHFDWVLFQKYQNAFISQTRKTQPYKATEKASLKS